MQAPCPREHFSLFLHLNALIEEQGHKQAKKGSSVNKNKLIAARVKVSEHIELK